jgi:hypothetical protein
MQDIKRTRSLILPQLDALASEFGLWSDEYQIIDEPPINDADGALQGQQIQQMMNILLDETLTDTQKEMMLTLSFGMDSEEAETLVNG